MTKRVAAADSAQQSKKNDIDENKTNPDLDRLFCNRLRSSGITAPYVLSDAVQSRRIFPENFSFDLLGNISALAKLGN